ncbi:glycosyltransferase family 4 protein [Aeromonas veronii]|uniref:glycosyltransferase family 4 protein n=1 Tax=Aeromonas veronii TaxID=654 RepID=UPI001F323786|nr:glycosyltransferase family 4 protein [Aeromonas veronii]MCF5901566.1 glycosyltransferase family 4 protein [Aeromonas veronii]
MNILVLMSGYPSEQQLYNCSWAHTRNKHYINNGINVDVFVFDNEEPYIFEGVAIITKSDAVVRLNNDFYSKVISHSPNIRNHIPFLKKYCSKIPNIVFMHGSESMWINYDYPPPYKFMQDGIVKKIIRNIYDFCKFKIMKRFLSNHKNLKVVFVSEWMKSTFEKNVMSLKSANVKFEIINNSLNEIFIEREFTKHSEKIADVVTIRSFDLSKYAIDLVVKVAKNNPTKKFHIYGKGRYFDFHNAPNNVTVIDNFIRQDDIPNILNQYHVALMPTRCDAQGVMVCEMATFGIPVITSDISVNREMFSTFENVILVGNDREIENVDIAEILMKQGGRDITRFSKSNTLDKEMKLLRS